MASDTQYEESFRRICQSSTEAASVLFTPTMSHVREAENLCVSDDFRLPSDVSQVVKEYVSNGWPFLEQDRRISTLEMKLKSLASRICALKKSAGHS
eukprot:ANDGO_01211.mRNA.1 hypothetical protein